MGALALPAGLRMLTAAVLALVVLAGPAAGRTGAPPLVVVLDSHGAREAIFAPAVDGLRERLSGRRDVAIAVEHLDMHDFGHEEHLDALTLIFRAKYAGRPVAAVVAIDEPAVQFSLRVRDQIFDGAPVVFAEVNDISFAEAQELPRTTGILGGYDIGPTLEVMRTQNPGLERVVVIDDSSAEGIWLRRDLQRAVKRVAPDLHVEVAPALAMRELEAWLGGLERPDAVLFLHFGRDAGGQTFGQLEALDRVVRASGVPVYGVFERMAGLGIVGGYLHSPFAVGQLAGTMVGRILDGTPADDVAIVDRTPHRWIFDFRALQRFGMPLGDLPAGATVIEEPDTFYYRYRAYFWVAVLVAAAVAVYIALLLVSLGRRRRAQQGLERLLMAGEHALTPDDKVALARQIIERVRAIAPQLSPLGAYRLVPGSDGPAPVLKRVKGIEGLRSSPLRPALADAALRTGSSQYAGRDALILLPDERLPVRLAEFRGSRTLDPIDQRLLDLAARSIASDFANGEATRLGTSIRTATAIQSAMLPGGFAAIGEAHGVSLHASLRAAREVGGDLYDVFAIDDDRLCIVVGDVSDKGIPAALLMAVTRTVIRAAAETLPGPGAILEKANAVLERDNRHLMFVTLFLGIHHRGTGRVDFANAGHNAPLLREGAGAWRAVPVVPNIALGIVPDVPFAEDSLVLGPGASLLLYTDGVTEAVDAGGAQFGWTRLCRTLGDFCPDTTPQAVVDGVLAAVDRFAGDTAQADDITLLCLRGG